MSRSTRTGRSFFLRRLILALIIYTGVISALWFGYHNMASEALRHSAEENAALAAESLTSEISAEFTRMNTVAAVIAGSDYVQDFLGENDTAVYYEKAEAVSEIVRKTAFPITMADSVVTLTADGRYYRFSGGLSVSACETLYETVRNAGTVYMIIELDEVLYFCHSVPVVDYSGSRAHRLGNVAILTGLSKTQRLLDTGADVDLAVTLGGLCVLANNPVLENRNAEELETEYAISMAVQLAGTDMAVMAAVPDHVLFPENRLFVTIAFLSLALMVVVIFLLGHFLSRYIIRPISDISEEHSAARQDMRITLLTTQMDAHFVINTLKNVKRLSDKGENEKTGQMAEGLAAMLQYQHGRDELVNVFEVLQMVVIYTDIMNIKFDEKFRIEYDIDDKLEACLMPAFILQPVVENALTHGLGYMGEEATLTVKGSIQGDDILFEISDNGAGMEAEKLAAIQERLSLAASAGDYPEPGLRGVALVNIQRRIQIRFGEKYGLKVTSAPGAGTSVEILLPRLPDES